MATKRVQKLAKRLGTRVGVVIKGERAQAYSYKLNKLREIVDRFDAKKFDTAIRSKPRTEAGKKKRAALLRQVSKSFERVKPFVHRVHKVVRPKTGAQLEELRKAVGLNRFEGLRGVPVPGIQPKKIKVTFDKKGRVTIKEGIMSAKLFRFPHMPRDGDDAIEMLEEMIDELPDGYYYLATRHTMLIHRGFDKGQLLEGMRQFVYNYQSSPEFLRLMFGVKWVSGSIARMRKVRQALQSERGRAKLERHRIKNEKAAREIAAMHKKLTGQKLPKLSKRARATGRR